MKNLRSDKPEGLERQCRRQVRHRNFVRLIEFWRFWEGNCCYRDGAHRMPGANTGRRVGNGAPVCWKAKCVPWGGLGRRRESRRRGRWRKGSPDSVPRMLRCLVIRLIRYRFLSLPLFSHATFEQEWGERERERDWCEAWIDGPFFLNNTSFFQIIFRVTIFHLGPIISIISI